MRLILKNRKVFVSPMKVAESLKNTHIVYHFEHGTNHLTPALIINRTHIAKGNNIFVDLTHVAKASDGAWDVEVLLRDHEGRVTHKYKGVFPLHLQFILGDKPLRKDVDEYVQELLTQIKELQEEGDIV